MMRSLVLNRASVVQERPSAACVEGKLSFDIKDFMSVIDKDRKATSDGNKGLK